jgi:hypothetical protein
MGAALQIYREHLPAGRSYAIKPSRLEEAIASAGIQLTVSLHQSHKAWNPEQPALCGKFYPAGSYLGGEAGSVIVHSYAVPSDQRLIAQSFAELTFIPALVHWVLSIEALPQNSTIRREEQSFDCAGSPLASNKRVLAWIAKGQPRKR